MGFWKMAAGGAVILGLLENFRELHGFRTTEYDIRSEKMRGEARVLFLSDLHNHRYGFRNRRLVEAVRQAKPDLILIGGDMLVGKEEQSLWSSCGRSPGKRRCIMPTATMSSG